VILFEGLKILCGDLEKEWDNEWERENWQGK
jgi:hypothetical protein